MDRLIEWTGYEWIPRQERLNGKIVGHRTCMERLAAYEDTGLTPEQITEIDKLYTEKCKELSEAKRNLPPCDIGDRIWVIDFNKIRTGTVIGLRLGRMMEEDKEDFEEDYEGSTQEWYIQIESDCMSMSVPQSCIGETIFLSYEATIKWFTETED